MKIIKNSDSFTFKGKDDYPNILLLHGLRGTTYDMKELGRFLHKEGFTVHCKLYSGHGVGFKEFYCSNVNDWYKDSELAYLELDKGQNKTFVCGLSMGGAFAIKLAEVYNVLGLITLNAPIFGFSDENILNQIEHELKKRIPKGIVDEVKMKSVKKGYSMFIDELGKEDNLKKVIANTLVVQGLKDHERFIKSSGIILNTISSEKKEIVHFKNSAHLITTDIEKKELFKTVLNYVLSNR